LIVNIVCETHKFVEENHENVFPPQSFKVSHIEN